ncbi:metallophosphoesterase family protein [Singulisphaera sp. PoT]|uniref:metallophosphoesterase family protein n=1 Tax=Singulisphaera sp. PoT TaxID=3411797 RepID=UPI003BF4DCF3
MRLGVISDIHGDFSSLEKAWSHLHRLKVDRVVCAGDLVDYGPEPDRVVEFLTHHNIVAVRGNHDRWALRRGPNGIDEFGGATPNQASLDALGRLPPYALISEMRHVSVIVHGSPHSDMEFVQPYSHSAAQLEDYLQQLSADILIYGHTHEPAWYRCEKGLVMNPGSIASLPTVESSRSFAIIDMDAHTVTFHAVETGEEFEVQPWPVDEA